MCTPHPLRISSFRKHPQIERRIGSFVEHDNHRRYQESLKSLTPADVYFERGQTILLR
jgi:hypothetical protein